MNTKINIYCERTDFSLLSEPLNLITNLAFILAALFGLWVLKKDQNLDRGSLWLFSLMVLIGIGSALFHSLATRWAALADTIPILVFQLSFLILYARNIMTLSWLKIGALIVIFFALGWGFSQNPRAVMNGSLGYMPALLFLGFFALSHYKNNRPKPHYLSSAAGLFILSLAFRSLDMSVCAHFPLGVHFMWHLLNAIVLLLATLGYGKTIAKKNN